MNNKRQLENVGNTQTHILSGTLVILSHTASGNNGTKATDMVTYILCLVPRRNLVQMSILCYYV